MRTYWDDLQILVVWSTVENWKLFVEASIRIEEVTKHIWSTYSWL